MKARRYLTAPPESHIPNMATARLLAQSASPSATYETPVFRAFTPTRIASAALLPGSTITGAANGAYAFLNLWRAGVQLCSDGLLGVLNYNAVSAKYVNTAGTGQTITPNRAIVWTGTIGAVTGGSSTGATATAKGTSARNDGFISASAPFNTVVVDPGTSVEETITLGAYNNSTGVFTIANSGKFANTHASGALVVVLGEFLWLGKTGGVTAADTSDTIVNVGASLLTAGISSTSVLRYEPGTARQEDVTLSALNTGSGATTCSAFAFTHAAGTPIVLMPSVSAGTQYLPQLASGDIVTFKWAQQATTGLALPESLLALDLSL